MRHVTLTTPRLWASMSVDLGRIPYNLPEPYAVLAQRAIEWFGRAGALGLTVVVQDASCLYALYHDSDPDPTSIFFDALFSYSTRWKEFQFTSRCQALPPPITRISTLTAADVPLLQSVSLCLGNNKYSTLRDSKFLLIPTLRHVTLEHAFHIFTVDWAVLTSITLRCDTANETGQILQQTNCLEFCDIRVAHRLDEHYPHDIILPFLKTLIFIEETCNTEDIAGAGFHTLLEAITAPILEIFEDYTQFFDLSLSNFLKRSPHIRELSLLYCKQDNLFTETIGFLRHCPSLTVCWAEIKMHI